MSSFAALGWLNKASYKAFIEWLVNSLFKHLMRATKASR
jgi:hypothetical protein